MVDDKTDNKVQSVAEEQKLPRWKSASFLFVENTFERFGYYGIRAVLLLFLRDMLGYDDDASTIWYHIFVTLTYVWPLFIATLADSGLGKFKAIAVALSVYVVGMIMSSLGTMPSLYGDGYVTVDGDLTTGDNFWANNPSIYRGVALSGLMLVAFGNGMKSCVSPLGGDQFYPSEGKTISRYFAMFYFSTNVGAFITQFITPLFREIPCGMDEYGVESCFLLSFWISTGFVFCAWIAFFSGTPFYYNKKPTGSLLSKAFGAVGSALKNRKSIKDDPNAHWLDAAGDEYDKSFLRDLKCVFPILVMYIPCPFFWALFDLQGSRWTLSATQLNGKITDTFYLLPDQIQALNPILVLIMIPLCNSVVYPLLARVNVLKTALQKMTCGMYLAVVAFLISGALQLAIEDGLTPVPNYYSDTSVVLVNGDSQCSRYRISGDVWNAEQDYVVELGDRTPTHDIVLDMNEVFDQTIYISCINAGGSRSIDIQLTRDNIIENEINTFMIVDGGSQPNIVDYSARYVKSANNYVVFQLLNPTPYGVVLSRSAEAGAEFPDNFRDITDALNPFSVNTGSVSLSTYESRSTRFDLTVELWNEGPLSVGSCSYTFFQALQDDITITKDEWGVASIYSVVVTSTGNNQCELTVHRDSNPATISILAFIPQYFVITLSEILVSVTGVEWAYTEAPPQMKAIVNACWVMTTCFGNLIDLIIVSIKFTPLQSMEYFIFAALMAGSAIAFMLLAIFYYEYVPPGTYDEIDDGGKKIKPSDGEEKGTDL